MYKKILVPLDGSELSEASLVHAKAIAGKVCCAGGNIDARGGTSVYSGCCRTCRCRR